MSTGQQFPQETISSANGSSTPHDLFALTDEQILEIVPEAQDVEISSGQKPAPGIESQRLVPESLPGQAAAQTSHTEQATQPRAEVTQQPPEWLAQRMKDPWNGDDAREFWQGIQNERQDVAAYREVFAKPEDARALKELYPGGVSEARVAAERARVLDDIDRAYFGTAGKSPQDVSASREQLAQKMMREDPAAFREMVFAGLRAIEQSGTQTGNNLRLPSNAISCRRSRVAQQRAGPKRTPRPQVPQINCRAKHQTRTIAQSCQRMSHLKRLRMKS